MEERDTALTMVSSWCCPCAVVVGMGRGRKEKRRTCVRLARGILLIQSLSSGLTWTALCNSLGLNLGSFNTIQRDRRVDRRMGGIHCVEQGDDLHRRCEDEVFPLLHF